MRSKPGKYADGMERAAGSAAERLGRAVHHASGFRVIPVEERLNRWRTIREDPVQLQSYVIKMAESMGARARRDVDRVALAYINDMEDLEGRYGG